MPNKKRTETDSLGTKKIDSHRLWGAQTQRSLENFKISNNIKYISGQEPIQNG